MFFTFNNDVDGSTVHLNLSDVRIKQLAALWNEIGMSRVDLVITDAVVTQQGNGLTVKYVRAHIEESQIWVTYVTEDGSKHVTAFLPIDL